jgi:hypothetical protein
MSDRYVLEVYELGSKRDVAESISADHPFGAIARGDLFNCEAFSEFGMGSVRVSGVEHIVWNGSEGPRHKICVYTEPVRD